MYFSYHRFTAYKTINLFAYCASIFILSFFIVFKLRGQLAAFELIYFNTYMWSAGIVFYFLCSISTLGGRFSEKILLVFFQTVWWFLLIGSFYTYFIYGLHLDHPTVFGAFNVQEQNHGVMIPARDIIRFTLLGFIIAALQIFLIRRDITSWNGIWWSDYKSSARLIVLCGLFSAFTVFVGLNDRTDTVPADALPGLARLKTLLSPQKSHSIKHAFATFTPSPMESKPNILLVLIESFRFDGLDAKITPHLYRLSKSQNCNISRKHYAGGHETSRGSFAALYGMEGYMSIPYLRSHLKSPALANLRANGYNLTAFDASGLNTFIPPVVASDQFDQYQTFLKRDPEAMHDKDMVDAFINTHQSQSEPFMSLLFFYASHHPYNYPPTDRIYTDDQVGLLDTNDTSSNYSRFRNSLHYIDRQLGRIIPRLDKNTFLVVAGDHGEEFGEFGGFGHAAGHFEDVRTRVVLIFCSPKGKIPDVAFSANADIWPTFFDQAGIDSTWRRNMFTGSSLAQAQEQRKFVALLGPGMPFFSSRLAIATTHSKYFYRLEEGNDRRRSLSKKKALEVDENANGEDFSIYEDQLLKQMEKFLPGASED